MQLETCGIHAWAWALCSTRSRQWIMTLESGLQMAALKAKAIKSDGLLNHQNHFWLDRPATMLRVPIFFLLVAVVASASAGEIPIVNCGSLGTITAIDISDCNETPCIFRKGETYTIDTTFVAGNSGGQANLEVRAIVSTIVVDIIRPGNNNACPGFSPVCPYTAGNTYTHRTVITISDQFLETDATVTLRILNAANGSEICARADIRVIGA